jgi:hypothetical protein
LLSSKFRARLLVSEKLANPYKLTYLENFFDKEKLKPYFKESKNFWYNFSRDLASYSLLSSPKKKKFRKILLRKNFINYMQVRQKMKSDVVTIFFVKSKPFK